MNDLLDRGDFTLTEILDEDDVLQEIKSMNTRLVDLCVAACMLWDGWTDGSLCLID